MLQVLLDGVEIYYSFYYRVVVKINSLRARRHNFTFYDIIKLVIAV